MAGSTPTHFLLELVPSSDDLEYIDETINKEAKGRPEASEAVVLDNEPRKESYRSVAENYQTGYLPNQIEQYRMGIPYLDYWKAEAEQMHEHLSKTTLQQLIDEYVADGSTHVADAWKNIALALRRKLKRQGHSVDELDDVRRRIESNDYWKPEAELFERLNCLWDYDFWQKRSNEGTPIPDDVLSKLPEPSHENYVASLARSKRAKRSKRKTRSSRPDPRLACSTTPATAVQARVRKHRYNFRRRCHSAK